MIRSCDEMLAAGNESNTSRIEAAVTLDTDREDSFGGMKGAKRNYVEVFESSEDEDDREDCGLTIVEPGEKRLFRESPDGSTMPPELQQLIHESGIDEILEEKAKKTKLTASHVKKLIKHIVTDENVLSLVEGTVAGTEFDIPYEPKLTRAKTKEILKEHMGSALMESVCLSWKNDYPVNPETKALATEDFPEDSQDDEDYNPEEDQKILEEDASEFGTPATLTPQSIGGHSTQSLWLSPCTSPGNVAADNLPRSRQSYVKRSLNFAPSALSNRYEQICTRTRSKYPMTGTSVEYFEMNFKPPDITSDMYEMECDDPIWKDFLVQCNQPPDQCQMGEEDEAVDPEYNLLADAASQRNWQVQLKEEMAAPKVSKKEFNELMKEFFDIFEEPVHDELEEKELSFSSLGLSMFSETDIHSNVNELCASRLHTPEICTPLPPVPTPAPPTPQAEGEVPLVSKGIEIRVLLPQFTSQQLEMLQSQMMQHIQLLTTAILLCHQTDYMQLSYCARNMINELITHSNDCKDNAKCVLCKWHLKASVEAIAFYDANKHLEPQVICGSQRWEYQRPLQHFTKLIQTIFLHSLAFPFAQLFPHKRFRTSAELQRHVHKRTPMTPFVRGEDWLLAFHLQIELERANIKRKSGKQFISALPTWLKPLIRRIESKRGLYRSTSAMCKRIQNVRRFCVEYKGSPLLTYLRTGQLDYSCLLPAPKIVEEAPCPLKNFKEDVLLPNVWMKIRATYKWQCLQMAEGVEVKRKVKRKSRKKKEDPVQAAMECLGSNPLQGLHTPNKGEHVDAGTPLQTVSSRPESSVSFGADMPYLAMTPNNTNLLQAHFAPCNSTHKSDSHHTTPLHIHSNSPDVGDEATVKKHMGRQLENTEDPLQIAMRCLQHDPLDLTHSPLKSFAIECQSPKPQPLSYDSPMTEFTIDSPSSFQVISSMPEVKRTPNKDMPFLAAFSPAPSPISKCDASSALLFTNNGAGLTNERRTSVPRHNTPDQRIKRLHTKLRENCESVKASCENKENVAKAVRAESLKVPKERHIELSRYFFGKTQRLLALHHKHLFNEFLESLEDFQQKRLTIYQWYEGVCKIFQDYPSVQEDVIVLLHPRQADKLGKFRQYCYKVCT